MVQIGGQGFCCAWLLVAREAPATAMRVDVGAEIHVSAACKKLHVRAACKVRCAPFCLCSKPVQRCEPSLHLCKSLPHRFPGFKNHDRRNVLAVLEHELPPRQQHTRPLRHCCVPPLFPCSTRSVDGVTGAFCPHPFDLPDNLAIGRIEHLHRTELDVPGVKCMTRKTNSKSVCLHIFLFDERLETCSECLHACKYLMVAFCLRSSGIELRWLP
jgi:hypothetical protein